MFSMSIAKLFMIWASVLVITVVALVFGGLWFYFRRRDGMRG